MVRLKNIHKHHETKNDYALGGVDLLLNRTDRGSGLEASVAVRAASCVVFSKPVKNIVSDYGGKTAPGSSISCHMDSVIKKKKGLCMEFKK